MSVTNAGNLTPIPGGTAHIDRSVPTGTRWEWRGRSSQFDTLPTLAPANEVQVHAG